MTISSTTIKRLKQSLKNDSLEEAIQFLRNANEEKTFTIFKHQKLLLFTQNRKIISEYKKAAIRLLKLDKLDNELYYLKFLESYLEETNAWKEQILKLLDPYLGLNIRAFSSSIFRVLQAYFEEIGKELHQFLDEATIDIDSLEDKSQLSEAAHNMARGKSLDHLFAATNLINIFAVAQKNSIYKVEASPDDGTLIEILALSSKITSYQHALDKLSYEEFKITKVEIVDNKQVYHLSFLDSNFELARDYGLKRMLSTLIIRKKKSTWLTDLLIDFANDMFARAWNYYYNHTNIIVLNNTDYLNARDKVLKSLHELNSEDELLIGSNFHDSNIIGTYLTAYTLYVYSTISDYLKEKSDKLNEIYTCPLLPRKELEKALETVTFHNKVVSIPLDNFIHNLPIDQHLKLFDQPFVSESGDIIAIDQLTQNGWATWAKSKLMHGGNTAHRVGLSWEEYVSDAFKDLNFEHVLKNVVLKQNDKTVTDIDLLVKRKELLLVIQVKVSYGSGVNTYEQWKFKKKLEFACSQVEKSISYINSNPSILNKYFDEQTIREIENIKPVVITNSHIYNGWKYIDIPIISFSSLMQIKNGARVIFQTGAGKIIDRKSFIDGESATNQELLSLIDTPLDWRISNAEITIQHHREDFNKSVLLFPILETERESGFRSNFYPDK